MRLKCSLLGIIAIRLQKSEFSAFPNFSGVEVLEKPKAQVGLLKLLYKRLAEILRESPGLYYR